MMASGGITGQGAGKCYVKYKGNSNRRKKKSRICKITLMKEKNRAQPNAADSEYLQHTDHGFWVLCVLLLVSLIY